VGVKPAKMGVFLVQAGGFWCVQKFIYFEFGVKHLDFGATYLILGAICLNFGARYLNFGAIYSIFSKIDNRVYFEWCVGGVGLSPTVGSSEVTTKAILERLVLVP